MDIESKQGWMSDFLEEMGLPASAVFQGYVLYNTDRDSFVCFNHQASADQARIQYVKPCAWAHRYPYIMLASDAAGNLDDAMEIQGLFQLGGKFLAFPI
ncbi:MAG: hypothetical protein MI745_02530 [Pseudomonadales bacterium]|nr:hypothetical protein [Pseudomonadales bacterium]